MYYFDNKMLSAVGSIRQTALCVNEKRIAIRCCLPSEIINFSWSYLFVNYGKLSARNAHACSIQKIYLHLNKKSSMIIPYHDR
jgi:hypothetical protein